MVHKLKNFDKSIVGKALRNVEGKRYKENYGKMDGSMKGWKEGGRGRNRVKVCRRLK